MSAHCAPNLHASLCAAIPNLRHLEYFHDHEYVEAIAFDGALDSTGGVLTASADRPGLGLELRTSDITEFLVR